jgi:hypothetical protein
MSETSADTPVAFVLQRIVAHEGVSGDDLERFLLQEVFPSLDTSGEGEGPDQHFLLNDGARGEYLWMSRLEYSIHQTPLPNWLSARVNSMEEGVQEKLESLATRTSSELYYDVIPWRRMLGK